MASKLSRDNKSPQDGREKKNYLTMQSEFIGELGYSIRVPPRLATYKHLAYSLPVDRFCGYTPTLFDLVPSLQTSGTSEVGPIVDLLNPSATYNEAFAGDLGAEDAALVSGLISDTECASLQKQRVSMRDSNAPEQPEKTTPTSPVDTILSFFNSSTQKPFVHPLNPSLKPAKVFSVLPHPTLFHKRYLQAVVETDAETSPAPSASVPLFALRETGVLTLPHNRRQYALYKPEKKALEAPGVLYHHSADFSVQTKDNIKSAPVNLLLDFPQRFDLSDLPRSDDNKPEGTLKTSGVVYVRPLCGEKVVLTKKEAQRYVRPSIKLMPLEQRYNKSQKEDVGEKAQTPSDSS